MDKEDMRSMYEEAMILKEEKMKKDKRRIIENLACTIPLYGDICLKISEAKTPFTIETDIGYIKEIFTYCNEYYGIKHIGEIKSVYPKRFIFRVTSCTNYLRIKNKHGTIITLKEPISWAGDGYP